MESVHGESNVMERKAKEDAERPLEAKHMPT